jgi:hypothetical protein
MMITASLHGSTDAQRRFQRALHNLYVKHQ